MQIDKSTFGNNWKSLITEEKLDKMKKKCVVRNGSSLLELFFLVLEVIFSTRSIFDTMKNIIIEIWM